MRIRNLRLEIGGSRTISFFGSQTSNLKSRISLVVWRFPIIASLLISFPAYALQQPPEETVVVTANAYPVPFENLSRTVTVLTREDINKLPVRSVADILAQVSSVDMRSRSPFGLQSDISLRGSSFAQVLILVDGVRINDSQTSHHNSDFPVQLQDIERVEVLLGAGSSIYGADAFGGIVNIITRRHAETAHASVSGGQYGFFEGSFSIGLRKGKLEQSISGSANRSSGFEYDRDFRSIAFSARTNVGSHFGLFFSHLNKEFGANDFYGPSPSKEWTNQSLVALEQTYEGSSGVKAVFQEYYRTHGDRFLYDIHTPGLYENQHRTHAARAVAKVRLEFADAASLALGGEVGGDWILSSNLGDHSFASTSGFGELQWKLGKTVVVYPGIRLDYYSNFGAAASPSLSGSWWMLPRVRLRSSVGRAFRIPTFTELYYRDPSHQASPSLKPESAWSADIGADFVPARNWLGSLTLFSRHERNVIDWVRSYPDEKWRTFNIRRLHTAGVEIGIERSLGSKGRLATHYSRVTVDPGPVDYLSKYVLDYARDAWNASASFPIAFKLEYRQSLRYKRRIDGRSYWLLDGRLEHGFRQFVAAVDFTNLLNSQYQDVIGVDMPGRWFIMSLSTR
jgi:outer membrane cobalamin receptor